MSLTAPKNTLAYQLHARPLSRLRSMQSVTMGTMANRMDEYMKNPATGQAQPETEAIWFYLMSHAMREITMAFGPNEPLPPAVLELVTEYNERAAKSMVRAVYYLTVICAREARHCPPHKRPLIANMLKEKGLHPSTGEALSHYQDTGDWTQATNVFRNYLPEAPVPDVAESLKITFYNDGHNGGYGGKPWAQVTECLESFVKGQTSAEVMLDTVWTLAHNNGPIFNKGFMYKMYTSTLIEILDLQRAGMIPRLMYVQSGVAASKYVTEEHRQFAKKVLTAVPGATDFQQQPIDWKQVKTLGAVNSYTHYEKLTQTGPQASPSPIPKPILSPTPAVAPEPTESPTTHPEKFFSISPQMAVKKTVRKKKA